MATLNKPCILERKNSAINATTIDYPVMKLISIFTTYIILFLMMSQTAWAQNAPLTPWTEYPGLDQASDARNFKNFRSLQIDPALQTPKAREQYSYTYKSLRHGQRTNNNPNTSAEPNFLDPALYTGTAVYESTSPYETPSTIEDMYATRIAEPLEQFGYELFKTTTSSKNHSQENGQPAIPQNTPPSAAVQNDFVLGTGDTLDITLTGQHNNRDRYDINHEGLLIIPDIPPIPAAGRTIGQVRLSIEAAIQNLHNTEVYVSLASVRQINALVIGDVQHPGRKTLTVFHTVLDALMEAGGINKTGSLRQIKLIRNGRSTYIDLYTLLIHGQSAVDLRLQDGDRIVVPAIGPTVAVSGEVKRPGIFEILPTRHGMYHQSGENSEQLTLNQMLELAGGMMTPGQNRTLMLGLTQNGEEHVQDITNAFTPVFGDGSILVVSKGKAKRSGMVELQGATRRPGLYALSEYKNLQSLLSSKNILNDDTYPLIGIIEREDPEQLSSTLIDFPLLLVIKEEFDRTLKDGDIIHLFSNAQIRNLEDTQHSIETKAIPIAYGSTISEDEINPDIISDPLLVSFLTERSTFIRGAIRESGAYPVAQGITLDSILAAAGGLALEANRRNIEVTYASFAPGGGKNRQNINLQNTNARNILVEPGASIRVNQRFDKIADQSVLIMGEVENPGRYDLLSDDRISDLIKRAGGLSDEAYPYGAIFSRKSERMAESARYRAQSRTIKQAIAAALETEATKINAGQIAEARALAAELEDAQGIGRITIEADPAVLSVKPELDLLLQAGDRIFIPKRDLTVRVHGEVLSPASLQFREGKSSIDYIHEAGGFTFHADMDRSFVLYPDGSAQPLQVNAWNYNPVFIPPGSTIVVPRDPKPFDFIQSAKDVSQILSNLAVTAIFIDDVVDGE